MEKKGIWFKRKKFGYGWTPSTWEGWLVTIAFILLLLGLAVNLGDTPSNKKLIFEYFIPFIVLIAILLKVTREHGEKPRWQWGRRKEDQ